MGKRRSSDGVSGVGGGAGLVEVHWSGDVLPPQLSHISALAFHEDSRLLAVGRYAQLQTGKGKQQVGVPLQYFACERWTHDSLTLD
jgi:hypothetical protein